MSETNPLLEEIEAILEGEGPISRHALDQWMRSDDIEVLGIVGHILETARQYERIWTPLSMAEYQAFLRHYVERCMRENPDNEWAHSSFEAGWLLLGWFRSLWADHGLDHELIPENKEWFARLYKEGDADQRLVIVQATLEHLFEDPAIAGYFSDWQRDPILKEAYDDAMLWAKDHPR